MLEWLCEGIRFTRCLLDLRFHWHIDAFSVLHIIPSRATDPRGLAYSLAPSRMCMSVIYTDGDTPDQPEPTKIWHPSEVRGSVWSTPYPNRWQSASRCTVCPTSLFASAQTYLRFKLHGPNPALGRVPFSSTYLPYFLDPPMRRPGSI